jgi:hypothetical protein
VALLCILVNLSFALGRKLEWDAVNERVLNDDEANRLLSSPGRGPWQTCRRETNMTAASEKFLADIRNSDAEVRYSSWSHASEIDPEVIPELGKLIATGQPGVGKAAGEALKNIVHSVGKEPGGARRAAVVRQLIALTADGQPSWTRTTALRHLSVIGGDESVSAAARVLVNAELQEEAAFCAAAVASKNLDVAWPA